MFTGIVETCGSLVSLTEMNPGRRLWIDCGQLNLEGLALGESISVSGACLTLVEAEQEKLAFDVSMETLARTSLGAVKPGGRVNLERALKVGDRIGGHFVSGHVDAIATVTSLKPDGDWQVMRVRVPASLGQYIAPKGSVTLDGVSLTVNEVQELASGETEFELMLVPHTLARTTLGDRAEGDVLNLEVDLLARYLERLQSSGSATPLPSGE